MEKGYRSSPLKKELFEKMVEGIEGLKHVETKIATSDRKLTLRCGKCGAEQDYPVHCGLDMTYEETELSCDSCGERESVPNHCEELMKVVIK